MNEWISCSKRFQIDWLLFFYYSVNVFHAFALNEIKMGVDKVPCECGTFNVTYTSAKREWNACIEKSRNKIQTCGFHELLRRFWMRKYCGVLFAFGRANVFWPKLLLVLARQKRLSTSSSRVLGDKINGDRKIEITSARNPNVCYKDKTASNRFYSEVSKV